MGYHKEYQASIDDPAAFWQEKSSLVQWHKPPGQALSRDEDGHYLWYADGELNSCYLALDYHVENGRGEQTALIYDSPVTGVSRQYSYRELTDKVARFAGALQSLGVCRGERVIIYMPMIPEAAIAMLACARLGAIHSVVFGGFAAHELALRIDDAQPKVILSASCGIEIEKLIPYKTLLDDAITQAEHKVDACVVFQREKLKAELIPGRDHDWQFLESQSEPVAPVPVAATDPLYILYTSGTTGSPKGVVRDNGGHAVAMRYSMATVYGMKPGDVFWAASDVGWVVGHSYIVYGPLMAGCTSILYEGKPVRTPDAGAFWRVCEQYQVNAIFSAPTAFRAICKEDPGAALLEKYDLSSLKRIFLAGERLDPATYHWLKQHTGLPVIDHWWQTETGWAIAGNPVGIELLPTKAGSATCPIPGFNVQILDNKGKGLGADEQGSVAIKLPLPPGCLQGIWKNPERFKAGYLATYDGYYLSGDGGYLDDDGYLYIMGRTDDVINVAGHRLSTGEMEEIVSAHPDVAECAVVGVSDDLKGQVPMALIVLKNGVKTPEGQIFEQIRLEVRQQIGALACLKKIHRVERLPKTRSGKILRRLIRQMADGEDYQTPSTIDDVEVITEISNVLKLVASF
ncbi:propionyl-CoA synthetase [Thalassomonas actiniarum]|uniref:Propionyl-CoA synthetase n=1 Tax=Thalassomonas actiniarum TaxID=485447 RepID=A0AAF0C3J1_9GAMM|nr:propionyl-CoA synthetase [Thalassomonas actiniarum]WDD99622.1 propionyl-CoA synthetase [Thalassomonas actiniarum]